MRSLKHPFVLLAAFLAILVIATAAPADIFHLKSGGKIEGKKVSEDGTHYTVKTKFGTQKIAKADVDKVEEKAFDTGGSGKKDEYKQRLAEIDPRDAEAHYQLGLWCKSNKLNREATRSFKKAITLEPQHEGAHKALGHVQVGDVWMSKADAKRAADVAKSNEMREKGLVQYKGDWVKPEDIEYIEKGYVKYEPEGGEAQWVSKDDLKKLEKGLVKYDGRWVSKEDADNLAKGLFKVNGNYVPKEEANKFHSEWENAWELPSEHYMLVTNKDYDYAIDVLDKAEKTYAELAKFFGDEPQLYGDKLYIYMFSSIEEYNQFGRDNAGPEEGYRQQSKGGFYAGAHPDTPAAICSQFDETTRYDWTPVNLYHALTVQYMGEVQPNITSAWLRESIVSFFERFVFYKWSLREDFGKYVIGNRFIPLADFMDMATLSDDPTTGMYVGGDRPRQVAQGGLLIMFLTQAGPVEYHEKFREFLAKMKKSSLDTETFKKIFKPRQLEEDFQAWIESLE